MVLTVVVVLAGPVPMAALVAAAVPTLQEPRVQLLAVVVVVVNTTAVRLLPGMARMVPPGKSALPTNYQPR